MPADDSIWLSIADASRKYIAAESTIRRRVDKQKIRSRTESRNGRDIVVVHEDDLAREFWLRLSLAVAESNDSQQASRDPLSTTASEPSPAPDKKMDDPFSREAKIAIVAAIAGTSAGKVIDLFESLIAHVKTALGNVPNATTAELIELFDAKYPGGDDTGATIKQQFERTTQKRAAESLRLPSSEKLNSQRSFKYLRENDLFVGNIPPNTTETDIRELFSRFGQVIEVDIVQKDTPPYALVLMSSGGVDAVNRLNGTELLNKAELTGYRLTVRYRSAPSSPPNP